MTPVFHQYELGFIWPELLMACGAMLLLVIGVFMKEPKAYRFVLSLSVLLVAATAYFCIKSIGVNPQELFNGFLTINNLTQSGKLLVITGILFSLLLMNKSAEHEGFARFEVPVLLLLAGTGMMLMISASNLLGLYVGLELQSLCLYVLAAIRRDNVRAAEAGLKYFVLGALSSGLLLFGISLLYGIAGSTDYEYIEMFLAKNPVQDIALTLALVFVLAGLAFKISAVPFHMWTPDVYEGAPTTITAIFAMVPKIAAIILIMRLVSEPLALAVSEWQQILIFLAGASMLVGAVAGVVQTNIKRLLAYSSIGNMGYALLGIIAGTQAGMSATLVYMLLYMVMTAGLFAVILQLYKDGVIIEKIEDFAGLGKRYPVFALAITLVLFSIAGIPPLAGFFGKMVVFNAAVASGHIALAIFGVLTSVVAAYYYLRIIKVMYFETAENHVAILRSLSACFVLVVTLAVIAGFVFAPDHIFIFARDALALPAR
ncbi:MAG: NADH-quinone oxidoreductase subunit NuoN [Alphaproteobacteria bacterium]|nr:NADH-quinone oxidoreductase subunit NuoN [Alphaproteobacteria bacterium]